MWEINLQPKPILSLRKIPISMPYLKKVDYVLSLSVTPPEAGSAVILDDRDSFNFGDQVNIMR